MTPDHLYEDKRRACQRLETGSHWPNQEEWFRPRRGNAQMSIAPYFRKPPELTFRQQQLYGLVRYDTATKAAASSQEVQVERNPSKANAAIATVEFALPQSSNKAKNRRWGAPSSA